MAKDLERAFDRLNKKYFNNELPPVPVKWSEQIGSALGWYVPPKDDDHGSILLQAKTKPFTCLWEMTLIHEMSHLKHRENPEEIRSTPHRHSKVWKKEMRRIAAAGGFDKLW